MLETLYINKDYFHDIEICRKKTRSKNEFVPVYGNIKCGVPNEPETDLEGYIEIPKSMIGQGDFFILRAKGDSMIEAGIHDGDLLFVRYQSFAEDGDIVVAYIDGEVTLKRLFKLEEEKAFLLHPENKDYQDIKVKNCRIIGIAEKIIKPIKEEN